MTIEEFIEARLDEDELAARLAIGGTAASEWIAADEGVWAIAMPLDGPHRCDQHEHGVPNDCDDDPVAEAMDVRDINATQRAEHMARHDPARTFREIAAKRRALHSYVIGDDTAMWPTVTAIASIWSDHPDYRQEWAS